MRYLVLADIHGNLQALDAVIADARRAGYDGTLCLGDLVGYGGDPSAVLARIAALRPVASVRGNHDKVCAGLAPSTDFNDVARAAIEWTQSVLTAAELASVAALAEGPLTVATGLEVCHGSPFDEDAYLIEGDDIRRALSVTDGLCLFGHTHVPALFMRPQPGRLRHLDLLWSGLEEGPMAIPAEPSLINLGAVGQPRDGDPRAAYGILDWDRRVLDVRRVSYDVAGAQRRILDAGLPEWLAIRLERGE